MMTRRRIATLGAMLLIAGTTVTIGARPQDEARGAASMVGPSPTLGAMPAVGDDAAVMLFDGSSLDAWTHVNGTPAQWTIAPRGDAVVTGGSVITRESFGDMQLHLEFFLPDLADRRGQARCNSGVYLHGRYEVQVLDTFGVEPHDGACGAIYGIAPPMVNASRPADTWQTYDIIFRAPRFDDATGDVTEGPRMTVIHNGIVIQNNVELRSVTAGGIDDAMAADGPLLLQDHGDPVRFRNIWVRRLN